MVAANVSGDRNAPDLPSDEGKRSAAATEPPTSEGVPTIVWVVLAAGVVEILVGILESLRFKRSVAYLRLGRWARRHGL